MENKAVILNDLIPLDISSINRLRRLKGSPNRFHDINIHVTDPMTGLKELVACLSIRINLNQNYIDVVYKTGSSSGSQRIELLARPGSIGKGYVIYFKCSGNGSSRRKLFLFQGRFVSKQAIPNAHYLSQIRSRKERQAMRYITDLAKDQKIIEQVGRKYFKRFYDGNLTKRFMRILDVSENLTTNGQLYTSWDR